MMMPPKTPMTIICSIEHLGGLSRRLIKPCFGVVVHSFPSLFSDILQVLSLWPEQAMEKQL